VAFSLHLHPRRSPKGSNAAGWVPVVETPRLPAAPGQRARILTAVEVITGTSRGDTRLSDALNARGRVRLEDASIRPLAAPAIEGRALPFVELDPFDIELVMAGRLPDEAWTRARRVHKVRYPVRIDAGRYQLLGILHVFPGHDPTFVNRGAPNLFIPLTEARAWRSGRFVSDPTADVVLVNRHLVLSISQTDTALAQDAAGLLLGRRQPEPARS
jgi:hypothetical protein